MPKTTTKIWGKFTFEFICDISPEADSTGAPRPFMPQAQYANLEALPLSPYGHGPFCKFHIPRNRPYAGLYVLTVADEVSYVGECVDLSSRYNMGYGNISPRNCYEGGQPTNCRINNLIYAAAKDGRQIGLWFLSTPDRLAIEAELIQLLQPPWNRRGIARQSAFDPPPGTVTDGPGHLPVSGESFRPSRGGPRLDSPLPSGIRTGRGKNRAGKYTPLQSFLLGIASDQSDVTLTFVKIEALIGGKLPESAHRYRAWWGNQTQGTHVEAYAWMDAGWRVDTVNQSAGWVRFVRA